MITPGPLLLSVTFDRPMRAGNFSFVQVSPETFPDCDRKPAQSADRRTFSMRCTARAGVRYEVWFNRPPYSAFQADSGVQAEAYQLLFTTGSR